LLARRLRDLFLKLIKNSVLCVEVTYCQMGWENDSELLQVKDLEDGELYIKVIPQVGRH
jgi:hypothetical protein